MLTATLVVAALARYPSTRERIDWGSLPNWLTVVAALFALAGVAVAYRSLDVTLQHRRDDEASQARLLLYSASISLTTAADAQPARLRIYFMNVSALPFSLIRVDGVTYNGMPCYQSPKAKLQTRRNGLLTFLPMGERAVTLWRLPEAATGLETEYSIIVRYSYLDNSGRRWTRYSNNDPKRVHGSPPSNELIAEFEAAMKLPPEVDKVD
jgi:hypothetical protein